MNMDSAIAGLYRGRPVFFIGGGNQSTNVPRENHRPVACNRQTSSHNQFNVVSST